MPSSSTLRGPTGVIASSVRWATSFRARRRGVIGSEPLTDDEALVIRPCRQVHTHGVGFDLDAVFCDRRWVVLHVETLAPETRSKRVGRARSCIELKGGRAASCGIVPGVVLSVR
jgi:uncharacterized protein